MIYACVIKLILILFDPSPSNAVIKVSLILALHPRFFIALHLVIGLRTIYRTFGIRSGMTGVRVAAAFRGSSEGGRIRGIYSPLILSIRHCR
jgi:hypothetical protein